MSLDLSQDFLIIDDPINVTYHQKISESNWTMGTTVAYVFRQTPDANFIGLPDALKQKDVVIFDLWVAQLGSIIPNLSDKITDELGGSWIVKMVKACDRDGSGFSQRYRLFTTKVIS